VSVIGGMSVSHYRKHTSHHAPARERAVLSLEVVLDGRRMMTPVVDMMAGELPVVVC
jgi:hypothetical protein